MRIFSESESLVSSPRVGKENIPPSSSSSTRRIMRARPEEFSSQTNSVNPSPKKQPRLNLLLSPSTAASASNWSQSAANGECNSEHCHEHNGDESCCKRYKLEDQLSDIQFIDCGTPEHAVPTTQTLYTSVQVHAPPKPSLSKSTLYASSEHTSQRQQHQLQNQEPVNSTTSHTTRYSYPSVPLGSKRKDQDAASANNKERFSYPGTSLGKDRRFSAKEAMNKMLLEQADLREQKKEEKQIIKQRQVPCFVLQTFLNSRISCRTVSFSTTSTSSNNSLSNSPKPLKHHHLTAKPCYDLLKVKNRNSYCGPQDSAVQEQLLRSYSGDMTKEHLHKTLASDMEQSKLSVTPSSPIQSPRYSLLTGDTSSENSSAVTTPQHDLEPLMVNSVMSGISVASSNQMQQMLLGVETSSCLGTSYESLGSNVSILFLDKTTCQLFIIIFFLLPAERQT